MNVSISKRKLVLLAVAPLVTVGLFLALTLCVYAQWATEVDLFVTDQDDVESNVLNTPAYGVQDGDMLGGERDVKTECAGGTCPASVYVNVNSGVLNHNQGDDVLGYSLISWDGNDDDALTLAYALNTNLTASGGDRFVLSVTSTDQAGGAITITVYTTSTYFSVITQTNIPQISSATVYTFPFSSFVTGPGASGPADFTDVGAITLLIDGRTVASLDMSVDYLATEGPTAVILSSFAADWDGEQVLVAWETVIEIDTVGFNLWRSTAIDGDYVQVNDALIPAASPGGVWGGSYSLTDSTVTPGTTYYYKIEELEVGGIRRWYGPASTSDVVPSYITVSSFAAEAAAGWPIAAAAAASAGLLALSRLWRRRQHA